MLLFEIFGVSFFGTQVWGNISVFKIINLSGLVLAFDKNWIGRKWWEEH
jgi:hypothetical protein